MKDVGESLFVYVLRLKKVDLCLCVSVYKNVNDSQNMLFLLCLNIKFSVLYGFKTTLYDTYNYRESPLYTLKKNILKNSL